MQTDLRAKGKYKVCRECGQEFISFGTSICSDECRKTRARKWRGTEEQEIRWKRTARQRKNAKQKLYAKAMRSILGPFVQPKRQLPPKTRACAQCGNEFTSDCLNKKICSDACRKERYKDWMRPDGRKRTMFANTTCWGCGGDFLGFHNRHYCFECRPSGNKGIIQRRKTEEEKRQTQNRANARRRQKARIYAKAMKQLLGEVHA